MQTGTQQTHYCKQCSYCLDQLPGNNCPECGQDFDLNDPTTYKHSPRSSPVSVIPIIAIAALVGCWFIAMSEAADVVLITTPILIGVLVISRRLALATLAVLGNPITFIIAMVFVSYLQGTGSIWGGSMPYMVSSINREYRCVQFSSRGMRGGHLLADLGDATLKSLIKTFGPMRGSYMGPYPDAHQADTALQGASTVTPSEISSQSLTINGTTYPLSFDMSYSLLEHTGLFAPSAEEDASFQATHGPITATIYKTYCLIVHVPTPEIEPGSTATYLIDLQGGAFIGYYTQGVP